MASSIPLPTPAPGSAAAAVAQGQALQNAPTNTPTGVQSQAQIQSNVQTLLDGGTPPNVQAYMDSVAANAPANTTVAQTVNGPQTQAQVIANQQAVMNGANPTNDPKWDKATKAAAGDFSDDPEYVKQSNLIKGISDDPAYAAIEASMVSGAKGNKGKTQNAVQAGAVTAKYETKKVFLVEKAKNYIESYTNNAKAITSSEVEQADWYRKGRTSLNPDVQGVFGRQPKRINEFSNDDSHASIRLYGGKEKKNGQVVKKDLVPPFTKFILESVQESHQERSQIVETFGDFYVFMFGERPPMYTFSGTLINAKDVNWVSDFMYYYDNYLRGTKCVEAQAVVVITYGGRQIEGYILNVGNQTAAVSEAGVRFSMQVVVTSRKFMGFSPDLAYSTAKGQTFFDEKMGEILDAIAGKEGKGCSDPDASDAQEAGAAAMNGGPAGGLVDQVKGAVSSLAG